MSTPENLGMAYYVQIKADVDALKKDLDIAKARTDADVAAMNKKFQKINMAVETKALKMKFDEALKWQENLRAKYEKQIKMNMDVGPIQKTKAELDAVTLQLSGMGAAAGKSENILGSFFKKIGGYIAAYFAIEKIKNYFETAIMGAAKFAEAMKYFQGTAADMENFRKATKGTVDDFSLVKLSNQSSDLGVRLKEQPILFALSKRAAEEYGTDVTGGFEKVTMATEGNTRALRVLGIQKAVYLQLVKDMAKAHGGLITEMDAETQKEIKTNALIKASNLTLAEATRGIKSEADEIEASAVKWENLKLKIGSFFTTITAGLSNFASKIIDFLNPEENALDKNIRNVKQAAIEQMTTFDTLSSRYETLSQKTNKTSTEKKLLKDTITDLQKLYPNYLGNINFEKDGYEKIDSALIKAKKHLEEYTEAQVLNAIAAKHMDELVKTTEQLYDAQKALTDLPNKYMTGQVLGMKVKVKPKDMSEEQWQKEQVNEQTIDITLQNRVDKLTELKEKQQKIVNDYKKMATDVLAPFTTKDKSGSGLTDEAIEARAKKDLEVLKKYNADMIKTRSNTLAVVLDSVEEEARKEWNTYDANEKKIYNLDSMIANRKAEATKEYLSGEKQANDEIFRSENDKLAAELQFATESKNIEKQMMDVKIRNFKLTAEEYKAYLVKQLDDEIAQLELRNKKIEEMNKEHPENKTPLHDLSSYRSEGMLDVNTEVDNYKTAGKDKGIEKWRKENELLAHASEGSVNVIASSWGEAIDEMLAKGENFTTAMTNGWRKMGAGIIAELTQIGIKWMLLQALSLLPGGGFLNFLVKSLGGNPGEAGGGGTGIGAGAPPIPSIANSGAFSMPSGYNGTIPLMQISRNISSSAGNNNDVKVLSNQLQVLNFNVLRMAAKNQNTNINLNLESSIKGDHLAMAVNKVAKINRRTAGGQ